jgi:hypothetical protein
VFHPDKASPVTSIYQLLLVSSRLRINLNTINNGFEHDITDIEIVTFGSKLKRKKSRQKPTRNRQI